MLSLSLFIPPIQRAPSPTYIQSFLNISVNCAEPADADRGLGTRNGPSSCRNDGIIGENYIFHRGIDPELERTSRQQYLGWPWAPSWPHGLDL